MSTNVIAIRPKGISSGLSEDIGCPDELSNGIAVVFRSGNNCMFDPARFGLNMKHGISHPLPHSALTAGSSKKKEGSSKNKEADDVKENLVTLVDSYADMSSACDVFFSHVMKARGWESDLRMYPVKKRSLIESCDSDRLGHYVLEPSPKRVKDYSSALVQAVGSANMEQLKLYCENGKSMDACNAHGESIIHISCRRGHLNVLMFLIENGGSAFVLDDFGRSPMHDACWCCNFEECKSTISYLLDIDPLMLCLKDKRGHTPLSYVPKKYREAMNEFLMDKSSKYWPIKEEKADPVTKKDAL